MHTARIHHHGHTLERTDDYLVAMPLNRNRLGGKAVDVLVFDAAHHSYLVGKRSQAATQHQRDRMLHAGVTILNKLLVCYHDMSFLLKQGRCHARAGAKLPRKRAVVYAAKAARWTLGFQDSKSRTACARDIERTASTVRVRTGHVKALGRDNPQPAPLRRRPRTGKAAQDLRTSRGYRPFSPALAQALCQTFDR